MTPNPVTPVTPVTKDDVPLQSLVGQVTATHEDDDKTGGRAPDRERPASPWLVVSEAAARARCGPKAIYRAVHSGKLRAAEIGGRRELRFLEEWVDEWITAQTTAVPVNAHARLALPTHRTTGK